MSKQGGPVQGNGVVIDVCPRYDEGGGKKCISTESSRNIFLEEGKVKDL